jgi:hypothetical protein
MEASQHSLLAACFTLHSINATLAIVPQRGAGLWIAGHLRALTSVNSERKFWLNLKKFAIIFKNSSQVDTCKITGPKLMCEVIFSIFLDAISL